MVSPVDVSFGGRVDAEQGRTHRAAQAGEVDDCALLAFNHLRKDQPSHLIDTGDVAVNKFVRLKTWWLEIIERV